jgi:hypothetical protein
MRREVIKKQTIRCRNSVAVDDPVVVGLRLAAARPARGEQYKN